MVTATHTQQHATTLDVTLNGEVIHTTDEHPFAVVDGDTVRWVQAQDLTAGDAVLAANGTTSTVEAIAVIHEPQTMVNLTVDVVATYLVGSGQWVVHNQDQVCNLYRVLVDDDTGKRAVRLYNETDHVLSDAAATAYQKYRLSQQMDVEASLRLAINDANTMHQQQIQRFGSVDRYAQLHQLDDSSINAGGLQRTFISFFTFKNLPNGLAQSKDEILREVQKWGAIGHLFEARNVDITSGGIYDNRLRNPFEGEILVTSAWRFDNYVPNPSSQYIQGLP